MRRRCVLYLSIASVALLAGSVPLAAGTVGYSVIPIPYVPYVVNNAGQVATCGNTGCYFLNGIGGQWSAMSGVGDYGDSPFFSINNSGVVTGQDGRGVAAIWSDPASAGPVEITPPPTEAAYWAEASVNDAGHLLLIGNGYGGSDYTAANGTSPSASTSAIPSGNGDWNDQNTFATSAGVYSNNHWTYGLGLWNPVSGMDLVETSVRPSQSGIAINNSDQAAFQDGSASGFAGQAGIPYFWNGTSLESIGLPGGCQHAGITGLDDNGAVLAWCANSLVSGDDFIWQNGTSTSLNTLVPAGWNVGDLYSMSSSGIIGAAANYNHQGSEYVLLVPNGLSESETPEPFSWVLVIPVAVAIAWLGRKPHSSRSA